jgi:hypothetical protein
MTLDELRKVRDTQPFAPFLMLLADGRQMLIESIGITPKGVILAVSRERTLFLAPEQIVETRPLRMAAS